METRNRLRVVLIDPKSPAYRLSYARFFSVIQSSLSAVKLCTPEGVYIEMMDENLNPLNLKGAASFDLIGISVNTATAPHAYQIADELRRLGAKCIVLGGIHSTYLPEEALQHCDTIVLGEAENVWPQLLADAQAGNLKERYDGRNNRPQTWEIPPYPRGSRFAPMHISRGCPFSCNYCCVHKMFGQKQRRLPIENVVKAICNNPPVWPHMMLFYDDNLLINRQRAVELCDALRPLNVRWSTMTSIDVGDDEDFLNTLSQSGCSTVLIGFETTDRENLRSSRKTQNLSRDYATIIRRIHRHGISVVGSYIAGFDHDDASSLRAMGEELVKTGVDMATFSILTPFPGTALFDELEADGRLLHRNWKKYTGGNVVFRPKLMRPDELQRAFENLRRYFFSPINIARRLPVMQHRAIMAPINISAAWAFRLNGPVDQLKQ